MVLDLVRGVAVLGILITNIQHFAMFAGVTRDPTLWGDLEGANYWIYALTFTLAYQRFLPVFAMLFGAGILLSAERREAAGLSAGSFHYRRMFVLLLIGIWHAYLIWYGDILVAYALCGMVAFLFRRQDARVLIGLGVGLLAIAPVIRIVFFMLPAILGAGGGEGAAPSPEQMVADDLAAFRGPWIEQFRMRASYAWRGHTVGFAVVLFWRACGLMAVGMGLFKLGVLTGRRARSFYLSWIAIALLVALPLITAGFAGCAATELRHFRFGPAEWIWRSLSYGKRQPFRV